jgi:hypothetical protein
MNRKDRLRIASIFAVVAVGAGLLGACTSSSPGAGSTTPSGEQTASPTSATGSETPSTTPADLPDCTKSSIEGALPTGSVVDTFTCTIASPAMWAAARLKTGSVFFLTSVNGPWTVSPGDALCGARKSEVPAELRSYCG